MGRSESGNLIRGSMHSLRASWSIFRKSRIRFSVRKCGNAKMPERFLFPAHVKPLQRLVKRASRLMEIENSHDRIGLEDASVGSLLRLPFRRVRCEKLARHHIGSAPEAVVPEVAFVLIHDGPCSHCHRAGGIAVKRRSGPPCR
jgi:hypothetical protein